MPLYPFIPAFLCRLKAGLLGTTFRSSHLLPNSGGMIYEWCGISLISGGSNELNGKKDCTKSRQ